MPVPEPDLATVRTMRWLFGHYAELLEDLSEHEWRDVVPDLLFEPDVSTEVRAQLVALRRVALRPDVRPWTIRHLRRLARTWPSGVGLTVA